jgi:hypothetical protein
LLAFCIMDIATAAQYMKLGYRVTRPSWPQGEYIYNCCGVIERITSESHDGPTYYSDGEWLPYMEDLSASDWEILTKDIIKDFPITYSD